METARSNLSSIRARSSFLGGLQDLAGRIEPGAAVYDGMGRGGPEMCGNRFAANDLSNIGRCRIKT